jgi:hypothetical protein
LPNNEAEIEAAVQAKGLNAPRLTPEMIDGKIMEARYQRFPDTTLTLCVLTLANGFTVTGESAAASPVNFDVEIGKKKYQNPERNRNSCSACSSTSCFARRSWCEYSRSRSCKDTVIRNETATRGPS